MSTIASRVRPRRALPAAATIAALLLAGACSAKTADPLPTPTVTTTAPVTGDKTPAPTPTPEPIVWPLTGVVTDAIADRPALAVKIENTAQARPQTGLDQADVVWEEVVDFGVARLVAVFHSKVPKEIGPVRSVRPADDKIIAPLHGLLAFSGGQAGIVRRMSSAGLQVLSNDAGVSGFYRTHNRPAPHNVYASPERLWKHADSSRKAPAKQFDFAADAAGATAATAGTATSKISVTLSPYGHPTWTWSGSKDVWQRSEGSTPSTTAKGNRLGFTNVVLIRVKDFVSPWHAQGGAVVPDIKLKGSGTALLAQGGKTIKVRWTKAGRSEPLRLVDEAGKPVLLAPGNTWVEVLPTSSGRYSLK